MDENIVQGPKKTDDLLIDGFRKADQLCQSCPQRSAAAASTKERNTFCWICRFTGEVRGQRGREILLRDCT